MHTAPDTYNGFGSNGYSYDPPLSSIDTKVSTNVPTCSMMSEWHHVCLVANLQNIQIIIVAFFKTTLVYDVTVTS